MKILKNILSDFEKNLKKILISFDNNFLEIVVKQEYICSGSSSQSPRSASLPFLTPGIRVECVPMFPFLHRISCMREPLLSSSCAACTADWYAQLGALPKFCNVSCPVYLWTKHTYQLVPPDTVGWSHTFTDFLFCRFPFFKSRGLLVCLKNFRRI